MAASDTRASIIKEFPCRIDEGFYLMGGGLFSVCRNKYMYLNRKTANEGV